jgi:hypothetical protein
MALVARKPAQARYLKALIHSIHGNGKTHFLGTAQEDDRTFPMAFLNFESGDQTLSGLDVDVYDMRDMQDFNEAHRMLNDPKTEYRSVGVDSVTETQVNELLEILERDRNRTDPDLLAQQDWGVALVRMRRFIRKFKFLPMHVIFTALSKDDMVPRVGQVKAPAIQGAFAYDLPGIVDVVGYLALEEEDGQVDRVLLLNDYPRFSVKRRAPWGTNPPNEIYDPTIGKLLDVMGYGTKPSKKRSK